MFNYIKHTPATPKRNDQIVNEIQEHRNEEQIKSIPKRVNEEKLKKLAKTPQKNNSSRPGHNRSYSYLQKYKIMKACLDYIETKQQGVTIVSLCESLSNRNDVKYSTVREWFYQVKKDNSIVEKAANKCSNQNYAMKKGYK